MKNSTRARSKFSKLEHSTGKYILIIALMQLSMSLLGATLNSIWEVAQYKQFPYIRADEADKHGFFVNLLIKLGIWFLSLSNLVPISLMVTLEVVKFF
jgi:hypothetical protein